MKLSKRLRKWRRNITTQTPLDYVLMLHEDILGFADEVRALERENKLLVAKANVERILRENAEDENKRLREVVAKAHKVQSVLCGDRDYRYCSEECPLWDERSGACEACEITDAVHDMGIEVDDGR
jgi:hypothetical protein